MVNMKEKVFCINELHNKECRSFNPVHVNINVCIDPDSIY